MGMKGTELDGIDQQVALLVYSGMDSHAIENMLNIPHKQLDAIYDKILKLSLAEVVPIRREIQLTTKGVRYITDATKTQTNKKYPAFYLIYFLTYIFMQMYTNIFFDCQWKRYSS